MPRPRPNAGLLAAILLVIVLLPAAYMGAYYASLSELTAYSDEMPGRRGEMFMGPIYRTDRIDTIFVPAHQLDRLLRPDRWPYPSFPHGDEVSAFQSGWAE